MTTKTFRTDDLFFTLMNVPGPAEVNYANIIKDWFMAGHESKYRYIEDSDIIRHSYRLSEIDNEYPGVCVIAVVSNPWARIVKGWELSKKYPEKFIEMGIDLSSFENSILGFKKVDPSRYLQSHWLTYKTADGTVRSVDYILREEHLEEDFKKIQDYFESSVPLEVSPIVNIDYKNYFTDETKKLAYEIFKEDIDFLGYEF